MKLEKLTALQLGEKIKQRQVSVLDGVKTVFEQIEKQDSEVHAYLDTYKEEAYKRAEEVQKGIEDGVPDEMREETYDTLMTFLDEDGQSALEDSYEPDGDVYQLKSSIKGRSVRRWLLLCWTVRW